MTSTPQDTMNADQLSAILASLKSAVTPETWAAANLSEGAPAKKAKKEAPSDKPKRVLSEDHKAKMQAGRLAKKAAEAAYELPGEAIAVEKPKRVLTEDHKAKMQEGRKKAAAEKAAAAAAAAAPKPKPALLIPPNAVAAAMVASATEEIQVAGKTYIRLSDGRCYEPSTMEGELGAWAGLFKNGVLDTTAREE